MSTKLFTKRFVLLDTEYTANENSKKNDWAGEHKEVIQIGALWVERDLTPVMEKSFIVRPVIQPILSDYIIQLTGISQDMVEGGHSLEKALEPIAVWAENLQVFCYGRDGEVIIENCRLLGIPCPIKPEQFINLRPLLAPILTARGIDPTQYSSGELVKAFNIRGEKAHNALNDMKNLLMVLQKLREDGLV